MLFLHEMRMRAFSGFDYTNNNIWNVTKQNVEILLYDLVSEGNNSWGYTLVPFDVLIM